MCFSVRSFLLKNRVIWFRNPISPMQKLMNDIINIILSFFLFDLEKYKSETLRNFVANITGVNTHEADNWQEYPSAGRIQYTFRGYLLFCYSSTHPSDFSSSVVGTHASWSTFVVIRSTRLRLVVSCTRWRRRVYTVHWTLRVLVHSYVRCWHRFR